MAAGPAPQRSVRALARAVAPAPPSMRAEIRRTLAALLAVLMLAGCGGSAHIRAGGAGPAATTPVPATSTGAQGGSVHVGRGLVLAIILGAMIRDGVQWAADWLGRMFPGDAPPAAEGKPAPGCGPGCAE